MIQIIFNFLNLEFFLFFQNKIFEYRYVLVMLFDFFISQLNFPFDVFLGDFELILSFSWLFSLRDSHFWPIAEFLFLDRL